MGDVYANGLEISGKAVDAKTIAAMPDVCFTPPENPATPPGVPVPYPSFGMAGDSENGTGTVFIGGKTVNIKNKSDESKTSGTEAGCAAKKGVVTSKNTGKKYFNSWSSDVKFDGEPVIRFSDLATHNHASPIGNVGPWPEICAANPAIMTCAAVLNEMGLQVHPHHPNPCDTTNGFFSEHYVEDQIVTIPGKGNRGRAKPRFSGYNINHAPCICMHSERSDRTRKGTEHYKKTMHAKDFLAANPTATVGQSIDACLEGTLRSHRKTRHNYNKKQKKRIKKKVQKKMWETVAECLKMIFLEYLTHVMNQSQNPTPPFTTAQVAAMPIN